MRRRGFISPPPKSGTTKSKYTGDVKDPFQTEETLKKLQPTSKQEQQDLLAIVNDLETSGNLSQAERAALTVWKTNLIADTIAPHIQRQFVSDFWAWLIGRGRPEDVKHTPWGRQSLADDPEVRAYVDLFVDKDIDFRVKLQHLSMRRPIGIKQAYLYYKYLVRDGIKEGSVFDPEFMKDWREFGNDFERARLPPDSQDWRRPQGAPHEMAPYGEVAERQAAARSAKKFIPPGFRGGKPPSPPSSSDESSSDSDDKPDKPSKHSSRPPKRQEEVDEELDLGGDSGDDDDDDKGPKDNDISKVVTELRSIVDLLRTDINNRNKPPTPSPSGPPPGPPPSDDHPRPPHPRAPPPGGKVAVQVDPAKPAPVSPDNRVVALEQQLRDLESHYSRSQTADAENKARIAALEATLGKAISDLGSGVPRTEAENALLRQQLANAQALQAEQVARIKERGDLEHELGRQKQLYEEDIRRREEAFMKALVQQKEKLSAAHKIEKEQFITSGKQHMTENAEALRAGYIRDVEAHAATTRALEQQIVAMTEAHRGQLQSLQKDHEDYRTRLEASFHANLADAVAKNNGNYEKALADMETSWRKKVADLSAPPPALVPQAIPAGKAPLPIAPQQYPAVQPQLLKRINTNLQPTREIIADAGRISIRFANPSTSGKGKSKPIPMPQSSPEKPRPTPVEVPPVATPPPAKTVAPPAMIPVQVLQPPTEKPRPAPVEVPPIATLPPVKTIPPTTIPVEEIVEIGPEDALDAKVAEIQEVAEETKVRYGSAYATILTRVGELNEIKTLEQESELLARANLNPTVFITHRAVKSMADNADDSLVEQAEQLEEGGKRDRENLDSDVEEIEREQKVQKELLDVEIEQYQSEMEAAAAEEEVAKRDAELAEQEARDAAELQRQEEELAEAEMERLAELQLRSEAEANAAQIAEYQKQQRAEAARLDEIREQIKVHSARFHERLEKSLDRRAKSKAKYEELKAKKAAALESKKRVLRPGARTAEGTFAGMAGKTPARKETPASAMRGVSSAPTGQGAAYTPGKTTSSRARGREGEVEEQAGAQRMVAVAKGKEEAEEVKEGTDSEGEETEKEKPVQKAKKKKTKIVGTQVKEALANVPAMAEVRRVKEAARVNFGK